MTRLSSSDWVQATRTSARSAPASRVDGTSASPCTARSPALASADSRPGSVSMTVTSSPAPWSASATCSASPFPPITTIRIRTTSPEKAPQPAKRGRGDDEGQDVTVLQRRRRLGDLGVPRPAQLHHTDLAGHVELGDPPPGQVGRDSGPDEHCRAEVFLQTAQEPLVARPAAGGFWPTAGYGRGTQAPPARSSKPAAIPVSGVPLTGIAFPRADSAPPGPMITSGRQPAATARRGGWPS